MNFIGLETRKKLRGGYYTPDDLADFLVRWIANISPNRILEPSCGNGVFFDKISTNLSTSSVTAFEIDGEEFEKASRRASTCGLNNFDVREADFLGWAIEAITDGKIYYDAVLGNPPFIRYQYLPSLFQHRAENIFNYLNCKFTKHTNAWVPFVLASFALLRPGGRLAMVVPAEIIHVMHASSLRTYLEEHARKLVVIDPQEIWFTETLQGTVLLLAEKKHSIYDDNEGIGICPVRGREFINSNPETLFKTTQVINKNTAEEKWTRALINTHMRSLLDGLVQDKLTSYFRDIADVDVGIVTGANKFFLVEDDTVRRFGLEEWAHPMFGRSMHCPGVIYDDVQHRSNAMNGNPTNFVWFRDRSVERSRSGKEYIKFGEYQGFHTRYKCRIRKPWYSVPSVYATDVGMLKRSHIAPRLILNKMRAFTTDTAYRIRIKNGIASRLVFFFVNPLTALSAELEGRHYGGGVLELVPSEIERLLVPMPTEVGTDVFSLDRAIRSLPMDVVLQRQGSIILSAIGLSNAEQADIINVWQTLRDRRHRVPVAAVNRSPE